MVHTCRQYSTSISTSLVSILAAASSIFQAYAAELSLKATNDYIFTEYSFSYPEYIRGIGIGSSLDYKAMRLEDILFLEEAGNERLATVTRTNKTQWTLNYIPSMSSVVDALNDIISAIEYSILVSDVTVTRRQPYKTEFKPSSLTFSWRRDAPKCMFPSNEMPGTEGFNYPGYGFLLITNNVPLATNLCYYGYQNLVKGTRFTHVAEPTFIKGSTRLITGKRDGSTAELTDDNSVVIEPYDNPETRQEIGMGLSEVGNITLRRLASFSKTSSALYYEDPDGIHFAGMAHTYAYSQELTNIGKKTVEEKVFLLGREIKSMQFFAVARFTSNLHTVDYDGTRFDRVDRDEVWLVPIQAHADDENDKFLYEIDYKSLLDLLLDGDKDVDRSIGAFISQPPDPPAYPPSPYLFKSRSNHAQYEVSVSVMGVTGLVEIEWNARELQENKGE